MRIIEVREITQPISSPIRNAYIDFSKMTAYGGFPDSVRVENGTILMRELPGIGFEGKSDLIHVMRELAH